jgi:DpnII restriction endonuclease
MAETSRKLEVAAASLGGLARLGSEWKPTNNALSQGTASVILALEEFDACVRYLNTRRSAGAVIDIQSEADVQDVIYLLLRPWIIDLLYESPADKTANRYVIKDFSSATSRFVIDAKYIRDKDHGRLISKELHDDIEMYRTHPHCDDLIFFVYDPDALIPDERALREAIEIARAYGDQGQKRLNCHLVVKP